DPTFSGTHGSVALPGFTPSADASSLPRSKRRLRDGLESARLGTGGPRERRQKVSGPGLHVPAADHAPEIPHARTGVGRIEDQDVANRTFDAVEVVRVDEDRA